MKCILCGETRVTDICENPDCPGYEIKWEDCPGCGGVDSRFPGQYGFKYTLRGCPVCKGSGIMNWILK